MEMSCQFATRQTPCCQNTVPHNVRLGPVNRRKAQNTTHLSIVGAGRLWNGWDGSLSSTSTGRPLLTVPTTSPSACSSCIRDAAQRHHKPKLVGQIKQSHGCSSSRYVCHVQAAHPLASVVCTILYPAD